MSGTEIIIVAGVVVGVAAAGGLIHEPSAQNGDGMGYTSTPPGGATVGQVTGAAGSNPVGVPGSNGVKFGQSILAGHRTSIGPGNPANLAPVSSQTSGGQWWSNPLIHGFGTNGTDPQTQAKLDLVVAGCETSYLNMSDDEKLIACKALNSTLGLSPPLNGTESWKQIMDICVSQSAEKGGKIAGEFVAGPLGGIIGGLCGAYLGKKIDEFLNDNYDQISTWLDNNVGTPVSDGAQSAYDYIKDKLGSVIGEGGDIAGDVGGALEDGYNAVSGFLGGIF